jgi:hypothetical protein
MIDIRGRLAWLLSSTNASMARVPSYAESTKLVVESWTPQRGLRRVERD